MNFLLSMPGDSEWILIIFFLFFLLLIPILLIVLYIRNRQLRRRIQELTIEKNNLVSK